MAKITRPTRKLLLILALLSTPYQPLSAWAAQPKSSQKPKKKRSRVGKTAKTGFILFLIRQLLSGQSQDMQDNAHMESGIQAYTPNNYDPTQFLSDHTQANDYCMDGSHPDFLYSTINTPPYVYEIEPTLSVWDQVYENATSGLSNLGNAVYANAPPRLSSASKVIYDSAAFGLSKLKQTMQSASHNALQTVQEKGKDLLRTVGTTMQNDWKGTSQNTVHPQDAQTITAGTDTLRQKPQQPDTSIPHEAPTLIQQTESLDKENQPTNSAHTQEKTSTHIKHPELKEHSQALMLTKQAYQLERAGKRALLLQQQEQPQTSVIHPAPTAQLPAQSQAPVKQTAPAQERLTENLQTVKLERKEIGAPSLHSHLEISPRQEDQPSEDATDNQQAETHTGTENRSLKEDQPSGDATDNQQAEAHTGTENRSLKEDQPSEDAADNQQAEAHAGTENSSLKEDQPSEDAADNRQAETHTGTENRSLKEDQPSGGAADNQQAETQQSDGEMLGNAVADLANRLETVKNAEESDPQLEQDQRADLLQTADAAVQDATPDSLLLQDHQPSTQTQEKDQVDSTVDSPSGSTLNETAPQEHSLEKTPSPHKTAPDQSLPVGTMPYRTDIQNTLGMLDIEGVINEVIQAQDPHYVAQHPDYERVLYAIRKSKTNAYEVEKELIALHENPNHIVDPNVNFDAFLKMLPHASQRILDFNDIESDMLRINKENRMKLHSAHRESAEIPRLASGSDNAQHSISQESAAIRHITPPKDLSSRPHSSDWERFQYFLKNTFPETEDLLNRRNLYPLKQFYSPIKQDVYDAWKEDSPQKSLLLYWLKTGDLYLYQLESSMPGVDFAALRQNKGFIRAIRQVRHNEQYITQMLQTVRPDLWTEIEAFRNSMTKYPDQQALHVAHDILDDLATYLQTHKAPLFNGGRPFYNMSFKKMTLADLKGIADQADFFVKYGSFLIDSVLQHNFRQNNLPPPFQNLSAQERQTMHAMQQALKNNKATMIKALAAIVRLEDPHGENLVAWTKQEHDQDAHLYWFESANPPASDTVTRVLKHLIYEKSSDAVLQQFPTLFDIKLNTEGFKRPDPQLRAELQYLTEPLNNAFDSKGRAQREKERERAQNRKGLGMFNPYNYIG